MYLPEYYEIIRSSNRITFLIKDNETNKIVEGSIEEAIEGIKYDKWQKRHPSVIGLNELQRMELDDDDPDFLSYDDYIDTSDELEEGDEDYSSLILTQIISMNYWHLQLHPSDRINLIRKTRSYFRKEGGNWDGR